MDTSLQSLLEQAGINAAMVLDAAGKVVGQRGRAIYDRALCEQVGPHLQRALDSIQLQHEDWEAVTAHFADGTILLRNLGTVAGAPYVLAEVADATLNPAFAAVSLRVAANKLKKALEGGGGSRPVLSGSAPAMAPGHAAVPPGPGGSQQLPPAPAGNLGSRPVLASTGLSWSRTFGSSVAAAADPATSAWLGKVARELARSVGPMAKVFVEEAIRRVSPEQPFGMALASALVTDLAGQIEDPKDRAAFVKAAEAAKT